MKLKNEIKNHDDARKDLEKTHKRLLDSEKLNDELEIAKESISK